MTSVNRQINVLHLYDGHLVEIISNNSPISAYRISAKMPKMLRWDSRFYFNQSFVRHRGKSEAQDFHLPSPSRCCCGPMGVSRILRFGFRRARKFSQFVYSDDDWRAHFKCDSLDDSRPDGFPNFFRLSTFACPLPLFSMFLPHCQ